MGKSKNNKGFTLAELIIAVAVLGIVISPLVANFIQSARINKKARISLNATNMAQDIMEGASAYTAEEFVKMFESEATLVNKILPAATTGYTSHGDCLSDGTAVYTANTASFDTEDGAVGSRQYTTSVKAGLAQDLKKKASDGSMISDYYLFADGVELGKNKYDLKFHLSTDKTKHKQNGKYVANIATINTTYDATSTLPSTEVDAVASEFLNRSSKAGVKNMADFAAAMQRNIEIRIENKDSAGGEDYAVGIYRTYTIPSAFYSELGITDTQATITKADSNISNLQPTQLPRSVYLYYVGLASTSKSNVTDSITVKNNTGKQISVYLIRTQTEAESTSNILYNRNYGAKVDVISTDYTGAATNTFTKIISNLRYDLSADAKDNIRVYQEGSATEFVAGRGYNADTALNTRYDARRCKYTYNGSNVDEALYLTNFSDGYEEDEKNFIYEATVEVYDAGTDNRIATFTGSLAD